MEPTKSYQRRSGLVRNEARARLAQIRKDRMARRVTGGAEKDHVALRGAAPVEDDGAALPLAVPSETPPPSDVAPSAPAPREAPEAAVWMTPAAPSAAGARAEGSIAAQQAAAEAPVAEQQSEPPATPEAPPVPEPTPGIAAAMAAADRALQPVERPGPSPASAVTPDPDPNSDLFALPGAGSGLVWMLQNAGVGTMRELADADPEALSQRLGLIGQILDIGHWIDFARARVGQAG